MPKPKNLSIQEILDEMKDLLYQEDDLIAEMEAGYGSLTSDDLDDIDFDDDLEEDR